MKGIIHLALWWWWLLILAAKDRMVTARSSGSGPWGGHRSTLLSYRDSSPRHSVLPALLPPEKKTHHAFVPRGGYSTGQPVYQPSSILVRLVGTMAQVVIGVGKIVLPVLAGATASLIKFYRSLPIDAILAQVGLVYCFLGGYYPTLFSSLQAARYCGWRLMLDAIADLTDEATKVVDEIEATNFWNESNLSARELFLRKTKIVLKTVDPCKINQATGALYTTWLGVSTVLQREYARVISLSLTLAEGLETISRMVLVPALNVVTPRDYRQWVPAIVGWSCKAMAMKIAWKMQRILTASTSAIAGGALFARSIRRMIVKRHAEEKRLKAYVASDYQDWEDSSDTEERNSGDNENTPDPVTSDATTLGVNLVGFAVGSLGFYTQMECQYKRNFSFEVPFPYNLVTWPFDLAERWIQWYITNY